MVLTEKEIAKLNRAADIREIETIMSRYVQYISQMDIKTAFEKLFAAGHPEVELEINECGGYVGTDSVKRFVDRYDAYLKDPSDKRGWMDIQELCTPMVVFSRDKERAKGQWSVFSPQARQATAYPAETRKLTAIWCFGKYHCEFIRTEDGWKLLKLRQITFVRAPYDIGWNKQPDCYSMPAEIYAQPDTPARMNMYNTDAVYSGTGLFNWGPYLPEDGSF